MPDTSLGFTYPASTDHARLWEHIQAVADDVNAYFLTIAPGAWQTATLLAGWTNRGAGFPVMAYRKEDNNKTVRLIGQIVPGTKTDGTAIFTLPVGYRPSTEAGGLMVHASNGNLGATMQANTSGNVTIQGTGAGVTVLLISVTFPLDAV